MPKKYRYECDTCDFKMPAGWGSTIYAVDGNGVRTRCPHPGEIAAVEVITGISYEEAMAQRKAGLLTYCVCTTCLQQIDYDLNRDFFSCPYCQSGEICSANSLINQICPKCKKGTFMRIYMGVIS